jgi:bifunctional UDP-N-acetylglucosamine pyrophosphorylase/glucosamine-1-phosphate N-acetyltransferase
MEAIVLAAGKGTRMCSELPKVLHPVFGKPVLGYVLEVLAGAGVKDPYVVIGYKAEEVRAYLKPLGAVAVLQREQKGTGHAVMMAKAALKNAQGPILIWPGDMPLVKPETLKAFCAAHQKSRAHVSVLSCDQENPFGYGRIVREEGHFTAIREELDATPEERRIREVNTGVYLFDKKVLLAALEKIGQDNRKGEYYLTDTIEILRREGYCVEAFPLAIAEEGQGINSQKDLANVTKKMSEREIAKHQDRGVTFMAPEQTFVAPGVKIGKGTTVYPWCFIEAGVEIGAKCEIGPFAKLRRGTVIGDGSVIGSFVEVNRSRVGKKVSAKHLTYLGDAVIGDGTNLGAGTITANFDGKKKHQTVIGKHVMIGSNTVLVAPVRIPDGAKTGAGSVVIPKTKIKKGDVVVGVPARPVLKKKR